MIYLSGSVTQERLSSMIAAGFGLMLTPAISYRPTIAQEVKCWAADNGCFSQPERFDLASYCDWLERMSAARSTCLFATAPDVLGNAAATLERSAPVLPVLREMGYPAALVAQDGLESLSVPWGAFDVFFLGGSTHWKLSLAAAELAREAKRRGKQTHMGRVNTRKRIVYAAQLDCNSVDGTHLKYEPIDGIDEMRRAVIAANGPRQMLLELV